MSSFSFALVVLGLALATSACKKENPSPSDIGVFLQGGNWRINKYKNANYDFSARYTDYLLTFSDSSVVTAANADTSIIGSYTAFSNDGQTMLRLVFDNGTDMSSLYGDWDVSTRGDNHLRLDYDQEDVETDIYYVVAMERD